LAPPTATPSPTVEGTRAPQLQLVVLGKAARTQNAEITINNVRHAQDDGGHDAPPGEEWIFIDLTVRNTGTTPFTLFADLIHPDGSQYERAHPPSSSAALDQAIQAGQTIQGEIAFAADDNTLGTILKFGPDEARFAIELGMLRQ
jgi:hypothetical protein